ncbi:hypothetical protein LTV02_27140 [Nocardia yamanashiensis]|uniref:hypothetical protein n=1 Tax=Nocardia yamanashiensis TaxID=209247 RepID=UPI001E633E22|nr:hypothetical protein [Nocardia yamanashiensis]UGT39717.1 hypothetical protein LTV02_27140 [Nocardia yamanashiensis]
MTNPDDPGTALASILARSESADDGIRVAAVPELGHHIDQPMARARLQELMTRDKIVTVRVDAAEQLVRYGGEQGLLAVLTELGRRHGDPDIDYTAYMLNELEDFGAYPVLEKASSIDESQLNPDARTGVEDLRHLMNRS